MSDCKTIVVGAKLITQDTHRAHLDCRTADMGAVRPSRGCYDNNPVVYNILVLDVV